MLKRTAFPLCFLIAEGILYAIILSSSGNLIIAAQFSAIVLCFLFAALYTRKENYLITVALAFTVAADFFLVVCVPIQQLWGMVFFLAVQIFYAVSLHLSSRNKIFVFIRILLVLVIEIAAIIVLGDKLNALVVISVCYYANLFMNIMISFRQFSQNRLFPIALVLFILCDTVIGLQVAAGGFLPIAEGSWLHHFIVPAFNLPWLFYLPSQVLISLTQMKKQVTK